MEEKNKEHDGLSKERLKDLLIRLKRVNKVYLKSNEEQRGKLLEALEPTFLSLIEEYSFKREFLEGLVIGGKDFLESLGPVDLDTNQLTELIFK